MSNPFTPDDEVVVSLNPELLKMLHSLTSGYRPQPAFGPASGTGGVRFETHARQRQTEQRETPNRPWYKRIWGGICKAVKTVFGCAIALPTAAVGGTLCLAGTVVGFVPVVGGLASLVLFGAGVAVACIGAGVTWLLCLPFGGGSDTRDMIDAVMDRFDDAFGTDAGFSATYA